MKGFWITVAATTTLLIIWGLFISFAGEDINNMTNAIDEAVFLINEESWEESAVSINKVYAQWSHSRLIYSAFFDEISISDVEATISRAAAYSFAEEKSSALAELAYLRHLLIFLFENETISIENIL